MRVKQLVVINLCYSFNLVVDLAKPHQLVEDREVAYGLFQKHASRTDGTAPKGAWWIEVNNTAATGDAQDLEAGKDFRIVLPANGVFDGVDPTERDVGVYIVFHARQSSDPNIFGVRPLTSAVNKNTQAGRLVGVLAQLKIRPIRKLSLVACHSDSGKTAASKNFLVTFGKQIEKWGEDRPMIAGYDDYVTAGWKDGHKVAKQGGTVKATGHKHVWCYKKGTFSDGYKEVELVNSGWSDKYNLPTNNNAAVF